MFADRQKECVSRKIDPDEMTLLKITSISIRQLSLNVYKTLQYNIKLYNLTDELVKVEDLQTIFLCLCMLFLVAYFLTEW